MANVREVPDPGKDPTDRVGPRCHDLNGPETESGRLSCVRHHHHVVTKGEESHRAFQLDRDNKMVWWAWDD